MHFIVATLRDLAVVERRHSRSALVMVLAVALAGCASRPGPEVLTPVGMTAGIKTIQIYVATTRKRAAPSENVFTTERANTLNFAKFVVGIPPDHKPGNIEWSNGAPDPHVSFATIDQAVLSDAEFRSAAVGRPAKTSGRGKKNNVLIFVHGFNNNFQESLYRAAQIGADSGYGTLILFAWPSQGDAILYGEDKAAASSSRDYLIELLAMVSNSPQVGEILVVAHSMGGMLTAEALTELRIRRRDRVIARLRVVLAAPDIDVDVFRSQVQTIGPLKPPLTVLVSKDDTALKLSSFLGGSVVRAGALDVDNPLVQEAALKAQVRIVDISQLQSGGGMRHDRLFNLAVLYPQLQRRPAAEGQRFGVFLFDAANAKPIEVDNPAPAN
jgi:esterase/lipase superfamily enzyme